MFGIPAQAKTVAPKKIVLNRKKITLYAGESKNLSVVQVTPKKASKKVSWSVKNEKIATVSKDGKVTALKAGQTMIVATAKGTKVSAKINLIVKKSPAKKEKECKARGRCMTIRSGPAYYLLINHSCSIIRSKKDFRELWKASSGDEEFKEELAQYKNLDYDKESVIFIDAPINFYHYDIIGVRTELDSNGKLKGVIIVKLPEEDSKTTSSSTETTSSEGTGIYLPVLPDYYGLFCMNRKEAARIEYFTWESISGKAF
jgi:hypothetical protein